MTQIWCAIPVYNNSATVADVARRCLQQIPNVLVVDDGSTDADLRDLLKSLDVIVVQHPTNRGKGAALRTALDFAAKNGGEYLLTLDGDGQHFPEDIPRFLAQIAPHTILIGNRSEITGQMPRSSLFGREFSDFWIGIESGAVVKDTQSGFRIYSVADVLSLPLAATHYDLEVEVVTRAIWAGMRLASVPIHVSYDRQRVSSFHPLRDNLPHFADAHSADRPPDSADSAPAHRPEFQPASECRILVAREFQPAGSCPGGRGERAPGNSALAVGADRGRLSGDAIAL